MQDDVTNIELLLTRGRALGVSFLILEQLTSSICPAARVSARLVVAFCTNASEQRAAAELLGLHDRVQLERLRSLADGQCVVCLTGARCPTPLLIQVPQPPIDRRNLTAQEREFHIARSLADQLPRVLPRYAGFLEQRGETKRREKDPNALSIEALKVFARIAGHPEETIEQRMAVMIMNRAEEEAGRKECTRKGYVCEDGTIGHGVRFFAITPKGQAFARGRIPVVTFKSGTVHHVLLTVVKEGISKAAPDIRWVSPEGATGSVQPDAYGLFSDGRAICVQIHHRNKVEYEVARLADLCRINHVDAVIAVAPTKKAVAALSLAVGKQWPADVPMRPAFLSATDCLADGFDWTSVLQKTA